MPPAIFDRFVGALASSQAFESSRPYRSHEMAEGRSAKPGSLSLLHKLDEVGALPDTSNRKYPPTERRVAVWPEPHYLPAFSLCQGRNQIVMKTDLYTW